jgi:hypothetical protein
MYIKASNSLSPLTHINTVACKSNYSAKGSQSATLGLKGQKSVSPEQHPGYNTQSSFALKGQKHFVRQNDFDPMDRLL